MEKTLVQWALARLSELSTWTGLLALIHIPLVLSHAGIIAQLCAAVFGLVLVLVQEARPLRPAVVAQDVIHTLEPTVDQIVANAAARVSPCLTQ